MAVNKVEYGDETLIDLTEDTVTPETLLQGETAHDKTGAQITGTATGGSVNNQSKEVTATTSVQTITPDEGYSGLSDVTVNPQVHDSYTYASAYSTRDLGKIHKYRYVRSDLGYCGFQEVDLMGYTRFHHKNNYMDKTDLIASTDKRRCSDGVIQCVTRVYVDGYTPSVTFYNPYPSDRNEYYGPFELNDIYDIAVLPYWNSDNTDIYYLCFSFTAQKTITWSIRTSDLTTVITSSTTTSTLPNTSDDLHIWTTMIYLTDNRILLLYKFTTAKLTVSPLYARFISMTSGTQSEPGKLVLSTQLTIGAAIAGAATKNGSETNLLEYLIPLNPSKQFDNFGIFRCIEKITYNASGIETARTETHQYNSINVNTSTGNAALRSDTYTTIVNAVSTFNHVAQFEYFVAQYMGVIYNRYDAAGGFVSGGVLSHCYGTIAGAESNLATTNAANVFALSYISNHYKVPEKWFLNCFLLENGDLLFLTCTRSNTDTIKEDNCQAFIGHMDRINRKVIFKNNTIFDNSIPYRYKNITCPEAINTVISILLPGDILVIGSMKYNYREVNSGYLILNTSYSDGHIEYSTRDGQIKTSMINNAYYYLCNMGIYLDTSREIYNNNSSVLIRR